jgi:hypothetical protein
LKLGTHGTAWSHHINKIQPIYYYCGESRCAATGCSIDSSVEFIQSLEHILFDLLDKMNVTFKLELHKPLIDLKKWLRIKQLQRIP